MLRREEIGQIKEVDRFKIITQQDDISEKKEQEFIDKINEILDKTDILLLNTSCNTENTSYAGLY